MSAENLDPIDEFLTFPIRALLVYFAGLIRASIPLARDFQDVALLSFTWPPSRF